MSVIRIQGFSGVVPRLGADLLKPNQARLAYNCRLTSGELRALREPLLVHTPANITGVKSIYRLHLPASASAAWLVWDREVDVVRSPLSGDQSGRVYYTGDAEPRVTNYALATSGAEPYPSVSNVWGVPAPTATPTLSNTGGGVGSTETRVYVYTLVAKTGDIDEESAPSPPTSAVAGKVDDTWTIGAMGVAPTNAFPVTSASWLAGVATYTVGDTFGMRVGEEAGVTGMNPAGFNVTKGKILSVAPTQVSLAINSDPGAFVAGGTLTRRALHATTGMVKRIYRSVTGSNGTDYLFVAEIPAAQASYADTVAATALGEVLPSRGWVMPPVGLTAVVSLPGGVMAGLSGNTIRFSEPYQPHAWPLKYEKPMDYEGVALGQFGNTLVAATTGTPYLLSGGDPESMAMQQVEEVWPCTAKRGMVGMGFGCLYPTVEGLALVGVGGVDLATKDFYTEEEWIDQLSSASFVAARYAGYYFAAYTHEDTQQLFLFNRREAASVTFSSLSLAALHMDLQDDVLYVVINDAIYSWGKSERRMTYDWMGSDISLPRPLNFGAAMVDGDFSTSTAEQAERQAVNLVILAANQALIAAFGTRGSINASAANTLPINGSRLQSFIPVSADGVTFTLYSQGGVVFSATINNRSVFRLPSGYESDRYTVRLAGSIAIKSVRLGTTPTALAEV